MHNTILAPLVALVLWKSQSLVQRLPQEPSKASNVSFGGFEGRLVGVIYSLMAIGSMLRPRWLPEKSFPPYAYLPGRQPHPVRDPAGHSYHVEPMPVAAEASLGSDVFLWGLDLFNHGYYWEAHEAWEGLWQVVDRGGPSRMLFKGLILLSAAGVKIREGADVVPALQETGIIGRDGLDRGLLQHDFGEPDPVGIGAVAGRRAPRQLAAMAVVPGQQGGGLRA